MTRQHLHYLTEGLGWYGMAAILGAYAANAFGHLTVSSSIYPWLNLTGAIGVATNAFYNRSFPAAVLNVIWAVAAVVALIRPHL